MQINSWVQSTFIFYISLMLVCYTMSVVFTSIKFRINAWKLENTSIIVPLLILLCVKGFAFCGVDLISGYKYNFESATSMKAFRDQSVEIGYRFINVAVRQFTSNYAIFVFIIAVLTIFPVFYVLRKYRNSINIPVAIMMYGAVFFLPGISQVRIYLASAICMFAFDALFEKKYLKAVVLVFVASAIHITAIVILVPCLFFVFKVNRKLFVAVLLLAIAVLYVGRGAISSFLTGRYVVYSVSNEVSFGTEWIWFYLPMILFYFYIIKILRKTSSEHISSESIRLFNYSSIWILMGAFFSLAQYAFNIFGRLVAYTLPLILFVASGLNILKLLNRKKYNLMLLLTVGYIVLRFIIYIIGYYMLDGIMPYINCFGWEI